jgi:hypothetical protein
MKRAEPSTEPPAFGRAECGVWGSLLAMFRPVKVHLDWGHGP